MELEKIATLLERIAVALERLADDGKGEQKQEVVSVSRREGSDGTPIIAFYLAHPKTVKKFLHSYLNTLEDVAAFETASGLKLGDIPLWLGERDIDKDNRQAEKYIVQLANPITLVWEVNPKWQTWSDDGGKSTGAIEPHKRILVRYDSPSAPAAGSQQQPPAPQQTQAPRQPAPQTQRPAAPPPTPAVLKPASRPYSPDVLKVKLAEWAKARAGQACTAQHRTLLAGQLEGAVGGKLPRYEMSTWLFGSSSTADIPCEIVLAALKDWLEISGWESKPSDTAIAEVKAAHAAAVAAIKATQKA